MKKYLYLFFLLIMAFGSRNAAIAQGVTSAALSGTIADDKGGALAGATVVAVHTPTGTKYGTVTDENGSYHIPNMRTGGPYTITISYTGYKTESKDNLYLTLGNTDDINIALKEEGVTTADVVVTAKRNDEFSSAHKGTSTNIGIKQINSMPTLSRSLTDFTRLTPQSSGNTFGGASFRYNNLTIDGAVNNDAFGFSPSSGASSGAGASGTPGSYGRSTFISLDAVQEVQVVLAPYDVKLGNFTGGSINSVTRSGTNEVTGSVYAFGRNQSTVSKGDLGGGTPLAGNFYDGQLGFRVGGPIIKDKVFFFINAEIARRTELLPFNADQLGHDPASTEDPNLVKSTYSYEYNQINQKLATYGFNGGSYQNYSQNTNSNKIFARLDFNLNDNNQLTIRHNYVNATAGELERTPLTFRFGSQDYTYNSVNNSTVAELKSRLGLHAANSLIVGYNAQRDVRYNPGQILPQIEITNGPQVIQVGTDREAATYKVQQNILEFTDNFTLYAGKNTFTFGTHNEAYWIKYYFLNAPVGRIAYKSINDFINDQPNRIRYSFPISQATTTDINAYENSNINTPSASFGVYQFSAYAQDDYEVNKRLHVSLGIRTDMFVLPDRIPVNQSLINYTVPTPNATSTPPVILNAAQLGLPYGSQPFAGYNTNNVGANPVAEPRFGFNWDVKGDKTIQIRGGAGIFSGRIPFAWFAYSYYNNGVNYANIDNNNIQAGAPVKVPIVVLPGQVFAPSFPTLPSALKNGDGTYKTEVDLIANNFKLPQAFKYSLAADIKLPGDVLFTVEGLMSKTLFDTRFQHINKNTTNGYTLVGTPDNRPYSTGTINGNFTNVYLLSNTTQGYRWNITGSLKKNFDFGLSAFVAYTYGVAKDISNGIRNSPQSNYETNMTTNTNQDQLALSNFDLRHRIVATLTYNHKWSDFTSTAFSAIYTGQSGQGFSYVINGDANNDGAPTNDLVYVPKNAMLASEINIVPLKDAAGNVKVGSDVLERQQLEQFIANDPYLSTRRGQYAERNGAHTPWNHEVDVRIAQDFNFKFGEKVHTFEITVDIFNFANLLNKTWGRQYFVPNLNGNEVNLYALSALGATNGATAAVNPGAPVAANQYTFSPIKQSYVYDPILSRWQLQLGLRYSF